MIVKARILSIFLRIREIWSSVREAGRFGLYPGQSGRLADNPGELAYMLR